MDQFPAMHAPGEIRWGDGESDPAADTSSTRGRWALGPRVTRSASPIREVEVSTPTACRVVERVSGGDIE